MISVFCILGSSILIVGVMAVDFSSYAFAPDHRRQIPSLRWEIVTVNAGEVGHEGCGLAKHHFSFCYELVVSLTRNPYGLPLSCSDDVCVGTAKPSGECDLGRVKMNESAIQMLNVGACVALEM